MHTCLPLNKGARRRRDWMCSNSIVLGRLCLSNTCVSFSTAMRNLCVQRATVIVSILSKGTRQQPSYDLHKPQSLSRSSACASKCLLFSIRPLDAQLVPFLARVLLLERPLHLVQPAHFPRIAGAAVHDEQGARWEKFPHRLDMLDGLRHGCPQSGAWEALGRRQGGRCWSWRGWMTAFVGPAPDILQVAETSPCKLDSAARDVFPIRITQHRSFDAGDNFRVARTTDAVAGHGAKILLWGAMIHYRASLAVHPVPWRGLMSLGGSR